jgi:putative hemolysin
MHKKTLFTLLISLFLIGGFVLAADNNSSAGILPNSPFYFVKEIGRNIQSFLTFNPTQKAELSLEFAEEKLAEIEALSEIDPDNENFNEYLEKYQEALVDFQEKSSVLVQNSETAQELLEEITTNTFDQEARLEQLRERIQASKLDEIKDSVIEVYTNSSLELATPEKIQEQLEIIKETALNSDEIISKIQTIAPSISLYIEDATGDSLESILSEDALLEKMNLDASELGISPEEILEEMGTISEEDKAKLESYAIDILTGNKSPEEIIQDVQEMELSDDFQEKIANLQSQIANPASTKCVNDGYTSKIITEEDGSQYGICVSDDGQECEEWDYYNGDCIFE